MFRNFFKTAFRNLWKNKTYSFLNIMGLAVGIASAALIFLWVEDELNYNNSFPNKDRLYRIIENQTYQGKTRTFFSTPGPMGPALKTDMPGVANSCRLSLRSYLFNHDEKSIYETGVYADSSLFSMFGLQFVQGNANNAFKELYSVVISEKIAKQFFGSSASAVGKIFKIDNKESYTVSGVIKDIPKNSTLWFDWIAPVEIHLKRSPWIASWKNNSIATYVQLEPTADAAAINKQLYNYIQRREPGAGARPFLFAMNDWRLRSNFEDGHQVGGHIENVRMFCIIALIIMVIACINFMNLATARSEKRAREVGVRKVLGAGKKLLVLQFIGEALFMSVISVIISVVIVMMVLPAFNMLVSKQLTVGLGNPLHLGILAAIALVCGLIAGSYPALYLSSFNPIFVFKGLKLKTGSAAFIRKGLVVTQFAISIILIISTIIIYQQVQHIKDRELGYNKDNLVIMEVQGDMEKNFNPIRQELINSGYVENAGLNSFETLSTGNNSSNYKWPGKRDDQDVLISSRLISPELISTIGLHVVAGRDFTQDPADTSNVIVTASFAKMIAGSEANAIGKQLEWVSTKFTIVGVTNDFIYGDMYGSKSDPVAFFCSREDASYLYIRLKEKANTEAALAKMGKIFTKYNPAYPFTYSFVDDKYNELFKAESLIGKLSQLFAALAIFISCLGLFGLAAYTAERRTKEIGIRKVLGASSAGIAGLLSKEFLRLVFVSAFIAFPFAWWAMNKWLQSFAYRITISWWVFLIAGAAAVFIALLTISIQSVKAARLNPVRSLRAE